MDTNLQRSHSRAFWREMGPSGHACQVYESHDELIETLTRYVGGGLWAGEAALVIARDATLKRLESQLRQSGLDLSHFRGDESFLSLSAETTLSRFMVDDWPDGPLFNEVVSGLVARARRGDRVVRAYGEMVAVLWEKGQYAAAIRLEHLWNQFLARESLRLLCSYPKSDFEKADADSIEQVRQGHTHFHSD